MRAGEESYAMNPSEIQPPEKPNASRESVWIGLGLGLGINIAVFFTLLFAVPLFAGIASLLAGGKGETKGRFVYFVYSLFGFLQLAYMIPLIFQARRKHQPGRIKGLIVAAAITFLIIAACDAVLLDVGFFNR